MRKTSKQLTACILTAALALTTSLGQIAPTATAATATLTNDPDRASVHDPSIAVSKDGKTYYAFGSHIEAAKSTDMVNWDKFTNGYAATNNKIFGDLDTNLAKQFAWAGKNDVDSFGGYSVWAPDVFWNDAYKNADGTTGAYMMYFCTTSSWKRSVIAYGVSQDIEGPYTIVDNIIYSDFTKNDQWDGAGKKSDGTSYPQSTINKNYKNTNIPELIEQGILQDGDDGISENWFKGLSYDTNVCPNALDPTVFEDKAGKLWMTYGSWSGGIYILEINPETGKPIYPGKSQKSNENGLLVDEYFGVRIAGGNGYSGEAPYILYDKDSDYYYLYVSYDALNTYGGYNMRLFRSKNPDGPYEDAAGKNATQYGTKDHDNVGIRVMGGYTFSCLSTQSSSANAYMAEGHNSALVDADGERYLIYHTRFDNGAENHQLRIHQQFLNEEGWPVTAVFENKGDKISETGYSKDDIIGTYEYINHGLAPDLEEAKEPSNITLNSDNTISGAVTGTWTMKDGTYYMSITIGSVKYSGVFFKQNDEAYGNSMKEVMTFTAIGTNNETIWGAKKEPALKASASTIYAGGNTSNTSTISVLNCTGLSYSVSYTSSKPSVASVTSNGKVTAKAAGTTTITAKIKIGDVTKTATKKITVKKASVKFSAKKTSLKVGKSYTYKAKGTGVKASSITFSSNKANILKITAKGKAKALKKGTATVTAKYKNLKATCKVKVTK